MPPPPYYVKSTRTPAWLRLGKIAACLVLVGLSIAVGMAFPGAKNAAAQGIHQGYTYSQRICQEYGLPPRWYNVRDPIAGSDWRNDGGWAIILARGSGGRYVRDITGDFVGDGAAFVRLDSPVWHPTGSINPKYALNPIGWFRRIRNTDSADNTDSDFIFVNFSTRYRYVAGGGQYVRWANMRYCH